MGKRKTQPVMEGDTLSDSESGDLDSVSAKKNISLRILLIDVIFLRLLAELQKKSFQIGPVLYAGVLFYN